MQLSNAFWSGGFPPRRFVIYLTKEYRQSFAKAKTSKTTRTAHHINAVLMAFSLADVPHSIVWTAYNTYILITTEGYKMSERCFVFVTMHAPSRTRTRDFAFLSWLLTFYYRSWLTFLLEGWTCFCDEPHRGQIDLYCNACRVGGAQ